MKKKILCILVMTLLIVTVLPVSGAIESTKIMINNMGDKPLFQPPIQWEKTYGFPKPGYGNFVQQTSDGGYIATGVIYITSGTNAEVYLVKTDANGNTIWTQSYGTGSYDVGYCVQQTSDGGYIIAGMYSGHGLWLIKTDSNGNQQWNNVFTSQGMDAAYSVQQTTDGGYILVGGYHASGGLTCDVYLIKTDAGGNKQWDQKIGAGAERGYCVRQTSDGGYIITGYTAYGAGGLDVYLIKTDAGGNPTWTQTFGGTGGEQGYSVRQTSDGGYIITGITSSFGAGNNDVYLIKTDAGGNPTWTQTFGGTNYDCGASVRQTSDGGYIIGGITFSFGSGSGDIYLIKTDAGGNKQWDETFGVANTLGEGFPCADQTTDGGYIIAGTKYTTYSEFWLIKLGTNQPPTYPYETSATDPDNDKVEYGWDWTGNGVVDQWDNNGGNYYAAGEEITTSHSWPMQGTYNVKVVAKDINGAQGSWSNPLAVTMPKPKVYTNPFLRFLENHPRLFPILRLLLT
jgi:hypothetical protein